MENVIILILFTYPGIMADYLHGMMIRGKQYDRKAEEYFRAARDFFLSAVISAAAMVPFCLIMKIPYSLQKTKEAIETGTGLFWFMALTMIFSAVTAAGWTFVNRNVLSTRNRKRSKEGKPTTDTHKKVWASVFEDPYIRYENCVMAVYQEGKLIRAGLPLNVSDDTENDPWAVLTWTETARMDLERPFAERHLLINPVASAVNLENGVTVDFYDGTDYREFISDWVAEQEREAASSERAEAEG